MRFSMEEVKKKLHDNTPEEGSGVSDRDYQDM